MCDVTSPHFKKGDLKITSFHYFFPSLLPPHILLQHSSMSWNLGKTGSNNTPLGPRKRMIGDVQEADEQHQRGRSAEVTERSFSRFQGAPRDYPGYESRGSHGSNYSTPESNSFSLRTEASVVSQSTWNKVQRVEMSCSERGRCMKLITLCADKYTVFAFFFQTVTSLGGSARVAGQQRMRRSLFPECPLPSLPTCQQSRKRCFCVRI